jgi:hypothetical protein
MIGHGRPASSALALARAALVLCACLIGRVSAQNPSPAEPTQLRITWGGGDAVRWLGRMGVDDGTVSNLKLLEAEPDAVGSIWLEEGQLRVRSLSAHKVDSVEVTSQVGPTAKLRVELAPDDNGSPQRLEIPLADLPRHPYQVRLDDRGNTLEVQVVPQPALRIVAARDPLIFAPGEQCSFELSPVIPNVTPGTDLVIQTTMTPLSPSCRQEAPWSDNQRLAVPVDGHPKVVINVPLARAEGAYTIHVSVSRPSGFDKLWTAPTRLATSTRLADRSFQVVVLDSRSPAVATAGRWESVLEIDPTNPRWIARLPNWTQVRRIPGLNLGALGSAYGQVVNLPPLGRFVELPPTPATGDPHWQAYSLPLEAVSVPHMLEIDYPADKDQHFGMSIVEPNANGFVSGINRDAGVYVEGLGRSEAKQKQTQRLVFWPRTQAPLLVVSNMHPSASAHFGQIRVFKRSSNQLSAGLPNAINRDRLVTAYLARPTVAETFGAARSIDATGVANVATESIDDPETAYESATRLADYLKFGGYNSAIVSIDSNGMPHSSAGSPLDVDGTELMLRVFDREGISLLPALDFSAPLPSLELQRRQSDAKTSGLEWVGRDGKTWLDTNGTRRGLAPYYNLLDPRVQQAILEVVGDTIKRYGRHPAFAGLAIQLSSAGYAQLPPTEWGLDDATFTRFARDKGIQPADNGPERFEARYKLIIGPQAAAWRSWRAKQVSEFYAQLATLIRGNGDRRLVLTTESVFADPLLAENMRPNLNGHSAEARAVSSLADVGIDREYLEHVPGVVLCPTRYVEPMASLPDRATDLELNEAFALWRQPSTPSQSRAAVLYHRPVRQRLSSFEIAGRPWRVAGEMQLVCQSLPEGFAVRRPYVEALAEHDPAMIIDGGERLPLGQEDVLREIRFMFAQLPTSAEVTEIAKQPVIVRTYAEPNQITVVAMNLSPWRCDAVVTLDVTQSTTLQRLALPTADAMAAKPVALPAGQQPWTAPLGPYETCVVRIPTAGAKVVDVQVPNAAANAELAAKLSDLNRRDLTAKSDYPALSNPSFEPLAGASRVVGWHLTPNSGKATIQLDPQNPQDGNSSLCFRCNGQSATVESDTFPAPPTGQLAMTVYARGQNLAPGAELQLVIECECEGKPPYQRVARVPAQQMQLANGQWGQPFVIHAVDLPLQSLAQMRIAFKLTGAGEVWLDNVNLQKVLCAVPSWPNSQADCLYLTQQIHAAKSARDAGQVTDCIRIIDGYWPRFILEYCPPNQLNVAERIVPRSASPPSPPQTDQGQEPSPGFGDRLKRLLPISR